MEGELLTIDELAAKLKVKRSWIYGQTRQKKIPVIMVGKHCRFDFATVLEWLNPTTNKVRKSQ